MGQLPHFRSRRQPTAGAKPNSPQYPDRVGADQIERGRAALAAGDWEAARVHFQAALAQGASAEAHEGLGTALWWLCEPRRSVRHREHASAPLQRCQPHHLDVLRALPATRRTACHSVRGRWRLSRSRSALSVVPTMQSDAHRGHPRVGAGQHAASDAGHSRRLAMTGRGSWRKRAVVVAPLNLLGPRFILVSLLAG